jgi:hypothetical protein
MHWMKMIGKIGLFTPLLLQMHIQLHHTETASSSWQQALTLFTDTRE